MKILSSLFLSFFLCFSAFAELHSELVLKDNVTKVKEGDLIEGTLKIWPVENADKEALKKLEDTTLFEALVFVQIDSIEPSSNNADVTEVRSLFLVKSAKMQPFSQISYKGQSFIVQAPALSITPLNKGEKDFYILEQSMSLSNIEKIIATILFVVLVLAALWKREQIKEFFSRFTRDPKKLAIRKYKQLFSQAAKREDYEQIYALRKDWLELIEVKAPAYNEFFKVMNLHQYKKAWGTEELNDVQTSFDIIRGSFK